MSDLNTENESNKAISTAYKAIESGLEMSEERFKELQEIACKTPQCAVDFAMEIKGADIEYCQKAALLSSESAAYFARDIPEADIMLCSQNVFDIEWAIFLAEEISDVEKLDWTHLFNTVYSCEYSDECSPEDFEFHIKQHLKSNYSSEAMGKVITSLQEQFKDNELISGKIDSIISNKTN